MRPSFCMSRNRFTWCWLAVPLFLLACAGHFLPKEIQISHQQLQLWVEKKFPIEKNILNFSVKLSDPKVTTSVHSQRITLGTRLTLYTGTTQKNGYDGYLTVSGQLGYDPTRHALVLRKATLEQFEISGFPSGLLPVMGRLLLDRARDIALYTLDEKQIEQFGEALAQVTITIFPDRIIIK